MNFNIFVSLVALSASTLVHASCQNGVQKIATLGVSRTEFIYTTFKKRNQCFDYYQKKDSKNPPLVVLVHGGGWVGGTKDSDKFVKTSLELVKMGYAVANFDYPLNKAHQNPFPAAISSLLCGLRYLSEKNKVLINGKALIRFNPNSVAM